MGSTNQGTKRSLGVNGESIRDGKRPRIEVDSTLPLCAACQALDIDAKFGDAYQHYERVQDGRIKLDENLYDAFDGRHFYADAFLVHKFGLRLSDPSGCHLCQFFRSLRIQPGLHERYKLLAFRSSADCWLFNARRVEQLKEENPSLRSLKETVFMVVVPDLESIPPNGHDVRWLDYEVPKVGAIFRKVAGDVVDAETKPLLDARELEEKFDIGFLKAWLGLCRDSHGTACKQRASERPVERGFRLIDCTRDPLVVQDMPWGTKYIALSYVWGSTAEDLMQWPLSVVDAVEVIKSAGMQYLWVDRLCIKQDDPDEKSYLISRMTTIYEEAEFTIVAAVNGGAGHGLPGIRTTLRNPQPKYYLDNGSMLLSILRDPRQDIIESQYWTRGWTYQEGALSNRRLVFTESQTYWECRCMAIYESTDLDMLHMPTSDREDETTFVMSHCYLTGIFKGSAYSGGSNADRDDLLIEMDDGHLDYGFPEIHKLNLRAQLRGLDEHIREFSKRRLTYDTDALLAFEGINGMYEQIRSLFLFLGIPMWTGDISGTPAGARVTFALSVSSWYHNTSSQHSMYVSEQCRRRPHLPSWTWAGWEGVVTWRAPPNLEHCSYLSELIESTTSNLVWAADIHLSHPSRSAPLRLFGTQSAAQLASEPLTLIEIMDPYVLSSFDRLENKNQTWSWTTTVGRMGRKHVKKEDPKRLATWYRVGRRLAVIGMSVAMTARQWTDKHTSGELVSVLLFAGRYHDVEHGTARFLTLRRVVQSGPETWERVGTLYLTLPFIADCRDSAELFHKIPARRQSRRIVIQ